MKKGHTDFPIMLSGVSTTAARALRCEPYRVDVMMKRNNTFQRDSSFT